MAQFLVESYVSRADGEAAVERTSTQARLGAEALTQAGRPVRYLRSIFVPEEETCFFLFEAETAADVREAARSASLPDRATIAIARGEEEL
jgi:hypothetical protein